MVLIASPHGASARQPLTVGVLRFGTVSWQLDTLKAHRLDEAADLNVEVLSLASTNATTVALQAGEVDLIVSDWVWVMRQRGVGADLLFVPYSHALGGLVIAADSQIGSIEQLAGKRIGVAGGPIDKSWLILQAWAKRQMGFDISRSAQPVFAAPPLLSEQLRQGDLHAVLTFWPDAARLEAQGFRRLVAIEHLLRALHIERPIPLVGYVFWKALSDKRPAAVHAFFDAIAAANEILLTSDQEWLRLRPIMKAESDEEFEALKAGFRGGIPRPGTAGTIADTEQLYRLLAEHGGDALLGVQAHFDENAFWNSSPP